MSDAELPLLLDIALWGLVATAAMTGVLQGANGWGLSRLSIPFIVGAMFTGNRRKATVGGFIFYLAGGWIFALLYYLFFASIGVVNWWIGAFVGLLHGILLITAAFPVLPFLHPRMASSYDGATARAQLEPPGFLGLNYGRGTPLSLLVAQTLYGAIIGGLPQLSQAHG